MTNVEASADQAHVSVSAWAPIVIAPGLLLSIWYLLTAHRVTGTIGFPLDDSWIHAQFARNLAIGRGFTYTGSTWISGSTAPLWTLVLASGYFLTRNMVVAAIALGALLQAFVGIFGFRLGAQLGAPRPAAIAAGVMTALAPVIVWGAVSGMEVPLAAALVLSGLFYHFKWRDAPGPRTYVGIMLIAVSTLARPENLALGGIIIAGEAVRRIPDRVKRVAISSAVAILIFAPLVIFSYWTIGRPLPTTFYAKSGPGILQALSTHNSAMAVRDLTVFGPRAMWNFWLTLMDQFSWTAWLIPIGALLALVLSPARRESATLLIVLIVVPFAMGVTAPQRLKPENVRYTAQLVVLAPALLFAGLSRVLPAGRTALAVVLFVIAFPAYRAAEQRTMYALAVDNIQSLHVRTAQWIRAHVVPDTIIAANDVGALAYFSRCRVLDLEGLVSPAVLAYRNLPDRGLRTVTDMHPDYILIFPAWYPDISSSPEFQEVRRFSISNDYISAGDTLVLYRTPWTRRGTMY